MRAALTCWILIVIAVPALGASTAEQDRSRRAHDLVQDAKHRFAEASLPQRRIALGQLEYARVLAPANHEVLIALGRAYLDMGFLHRATKIFERVLRDSAGDADALYGLGQASERDWLESGTLGSLNEAIRRFDETTRARASFCEAWTTLAALRFERGDPDAGFDAAWGALENTPERPDAQLSAAYLAYRTGHVALAESLFRVALPRLSPAIAARFADISPLLGENQGESLANWTPAVRAEFVRRFWSESNPDPTAPGNLAQLEFWSRIAHATLLLGDAWAPHWKKRTELYARYGRKVQVADLMGPRHYEMPRLDWGEEASAPTPEALASLGQRMTSNGLAVFAPLPPRVQELPMASRLARFEGEHGAHLVAEIQTPGTPADSLTANCVVLDGSEREVARASHALSPSGCDPAELRTAEFSFDLPAGRYRFAFAVVNARDDRGVRSVFQNVAAAAPRLAMSDVVLTCGLPDPVGSQGAVRLDLNLAARVEDLMPLFLYFEIYHLRTDPAGGNRFTYEYAVQATRREKHGPPLPSFSAAQEGVGSLRRQFIRIPVGGLAPGRYRLAVRVRDLIGVEEAEGLADFEKMAPGDRAASDR